MRIITLNANGIRSAVTKGVFKWLSTVQADIICFQETKAHMNILRENFPLLEKYHCYFHDAVKPGYSGVAIFSRVEPKNVITGLGWHSADSEGRYIEADYGRFSVASLYMPSGSSGEIRQAIKFEFMQHFRKKLEEIKTSKKPIIICGDWNIVHKEIDIRNFKSNQKHSGCLPEERAWLDDVFTNLGFIDGFRVVNKEPDQYTWWSTRGQAWAKNVGWRIDYQILSPAMKAQVKAVEIYKQQRFSDHAPLIMDYDI